MSANIHQSRAITTLHGTQLSKLLSGDMGVAERETEATI